MVDKSIEMYKDERVDILLATYNSEIYLKELVKSLLEQSYSNIRIYISDDMSSDSTPEIIKAMSRCDPRITLLGCEKRFGSAKANFLNLLRYSSAKYTMFCDHDDVWYPNKVEDTLLCMKQLEEEGGTECPGLVYTDAVVVDKDLNVISSSHTEYGNMPHEGKELTLPRVLAHNPVVGCTAMINCPLRDLIVNYQINPDVIWMHDWAIAIIAAAVGTIRYLPKQTMMYRQTGKNSVGARASNHVDSGVVFEADKRFRASFVQAEHIEEVYKGILPNNAINCIHQYAQIPAMGRVKRIITILTKGYRKRGFTRLLAEIVFCLRMRREKQ